MPPLTKILCSGKPNRRKRNVARPPMGPYMQLFFQIWDHILQNDPQPTEQPKFMNDDTNDGESDE
jgi:hypothetical protein